MSKLELTASELIIASMQGTLEGLAERYNIKIIPDNTISGLSKQLSDIRMQINPTDGDEG